MAKRARRRFVQPGELNWLQEAYFNRPEQTLQLAEGDILMQQGEPNNRLYLVLEGTLCAYIEDEEGQPFELFRASAHAFVGVSSFFSHHPDSYTTLIAQTTTRLAYIDDRQERVADPQDKSFIEQFMPVVMDVLMERQLLAQEAAARRHQTLKQMLQQEKMAVLGQLSAGIAHELNNAISVILRRSQWLSEELQTYLKDNESQQISTLFQRGLEQGRSFSSEELRQRRRALESQGGLSAQEARKWAETGLPAQEVLRYSGQTDAAMWPRYWEWGAAFHDLLTASRHSTHVVGAIKQLGVVHRRPEQTTTIPETLQEALVLLQNQLRHVEVTLSLDHSPDSPLPAVMGNRGDLIQVWLNLLKNACESMLGASTPAPQLTIRATRQGHHLEVCITDNGPGIPKALLPRIFEPQFTTKSDGPSVGLGLGLTIVQQIIEHLDGHLKVLSQPGETTFIVHLPIPA